VNEDIPENVVAVGVPAKEIRKLSKEEINETAYYSI
jgi:serine acetyltransferase